MKIPRAIVREDDSFAEARKNPGKWVLYKEMTGTSALQTSRKYNMAQGAEGLEFGVEGDKLYVRSRV